MINENHRQNSIWKKANYLLLNNKVRLDDTVTNAFYFKVGNNFEVRINRYNITDNNCTCKWFSLHQTECSHIMACKLYIIKGGLK